MPSLTPEQVASLREDTPGAANYLHLNNAGAALMPRPVLDAIKDHLDLEARIGGYEAAAATRSQWKNFYEAFGRLLHGQPENIAFCVSATDAYNRALGSMAFQPGDRILTTRQDYASNQIAFLQLRKRFGVELLWAEDNEEGIVDVDSLHELLRTRQPRLVAVTHIPSSRGLVQPVAEIGHICRQYDTVYLVDACQSVGQLELDLRDLPCDFLSGTLRKFLRGPRGVGFLYASDRILGSDRAPLFLDLYGATWTDTTTYRAAPTARRFENFEKAYALMLGAAQAVEYAADLGMPRIQARVEQLSTQLRERLRTHERVRLLDRGTQACGIVTLTVDGIEKPAALHRALLDRHINTAYAGPSNARFATEQDAAPWVLRLSPHYYNTEEEIGRAAEALFEILDAG